MAKKIKHDLSRIGKEPDYSLANQRRISDERVQYLANKNGIGFLVITIKKLSK